MTDIPTAALRIQCEMTNPPRPVGCAVMVGKTIVAVAPLEEVRSAAAASRAYEVGNSVAVVTRLQRIRLHAVGSRMPLGGHRDCERIEAALGSRDDDAVGTVRLISEWVKIVDGFAGRS